MNELLLVMMLLAMAFIYYAS